MWNWSHRSNHSQQSQWCREKKVKINVLSLYYIFTQNELMFKDPSRLQESSSVLVYPYVQNVSFRQSSSLQFSIYRTAPKTSASFHLASFIIYLCVSFFPSLSRKEIVTTNQFPYHFQLVAPDTLSDADVYRCNQTHFHRGCRLRCPQRRPLCRTLRSDIAHVPLLPSFVIEI